MAGRNARFKRPLGRRRYRRLFVLATEGMFEYWLLLHFEDGGEVAAARECRDRLARHLPRGAKGGLPIESLKGLVDGAVERAMRRDCPPCPDWPRRAGTTVYRLVQALRGC